MIAAEHMAFVALGAIVAPLTGALLMLGPGRRLRTLAAVIVLFATATAAVLCLLLAVAAVRPTEHVLVLIRLVPPIPLALRVDAVGSLFALTVALLNLLASLHALVWLREDRRQWQFHAVLLTCLGLMLLVAFAANLLTLLVGYELFSLAAVVLIVHERSRMAFAAGFKYLSYILPGAGLTLIGAVLMFHLFGSIAFSPGGVVTGTPPLSAYVAWVCLVAGFGIKAALFPLHGWVPDAHPAAPAPFSAVLSGVMVATGTFAMLRVLLELFGPAALVRMDVMPWLGGAAGVGVVVAGALALGEDNLKRRLAWSTISQMSYVLLAASLLNAQALAGALAHLANHAFIKGGLFFCAGALIFGAGVHRVSELGGLARRMPLTATALTVLSLALIGVPPSSGFIGKWTMASGMASEGALLPLLVLLLGSVLAALYLWPVLAAIWSREGLGDDASRNAHDPPRTMLLAMLSAAVLSVLFGLAAGLIGYPLGLAERAAQLLIAGTMP